MASFVSAARRLWSVGFCHLQPLQLACLQYGVELNLDVARYLGARSHFVNRGYRSRYISAFPLKKGRLQFEVVALLVKVLSHVTDPLYRLRFHRVCKFDMGRIHQNAAYDDGVRSPEVLRKFIKPLGQYVGCRNPYRAAF